MTGSSLVSGPDSFFLAVLGTVTVTRLYLHGASALRRRFGTPRVPLLSLGGVRIHHYAYGAIICLIGFLISRTDVMAIGLGLIADEAWFVIGLGSDDRRYPSRSSLAGAAAALLVILLLRGRLFALASF